MREREATPRCLCFVLVLVASALAFAGVARGGLDARWYSFDRPCTARKDPVTVVFYYRALATWVDTHLGHHTGWGDTWFDGSVQYYETGGVCSPQQGSRANGSFSESRFHVRWREGTYSDSTYGAFSHATPHYERKVDCGHAVTPTTGGWSGYDEGRRAIYNAMSGPHSTYVKYVGNSAVMVQCNGWAAASNGNVRYVRISTSG